MGYSTDFDGKFDVSPQIKPEHAAYLKQFRETRRMRRNPHLAERLADPIRVAAGLPVGAQGAYFVGAGGVFGQDRTPDVLDYNHPPDGQPGLWCQWVPTEDRNGIEWDGGEKFYCYVEWLEYLLEHFLRPWGYVVTGSVRWRGEEFSDIGTIAIVDGRPVVHQGW